MITQQKYNYMYANMNEIVSQSYFNTYSFIIYIYRKNRASCKISAFQVIFISVVRTLNTETIFIYNTERTFDFDILNT